MHVVQHWLTMSWAIVLSGVTSGFHSLVKTRFNCSAWLMRSIRSLHSTQYTLHRAAVTDCVRTNWCERISDWLSDASSLNNAACVTSRNDVDDDGDADNNDDKCREITAATAQYIYCPYVERSFSTFSQLRLRLFWRCSRWRHQRWSRKIHNGRSPRTQLAYQKSHQEFS